MESNNYICGGNKFIYNKGYIGLPILAPKLPEKISIDGLVLHKKTKFHVSLLCVKNIIDNDNLGENEILSAFCSFVKENNIEFLKFENEIRLAKFEDRVSVVVMCSVSNLLNLPTEVGKKLGIEIPIQPAHVTLFTLQPEVGIGLNSYEDLATKSVTIDLPEIYSLIG